MVVRYDSYMYNVKVVSLIHQSFDELAIVNIVAGKIYLALGSLSAAWPLKCSRTGRNCTQAVFLT